MGNVRKHRFESRLTPLAVKRLKRPGYHADGAGLYLQVSESGAKSWVLRYTLFGKKHEMGLGSVTTYDVVDARERARKYRKLVDDSIDPIAHRNAEHAQREAEQAQRRTFREACEEYVAAHKKDWKNEKHRDQWLNTLESYAWPSMGHKDVSAITKADILAAVDPIWREKHETALRLRGRIKSVLEWAAARDWRKDHNPNLWNEVARALPKVSRKRQTTHFAAAPYSDVAGLLATVKGGTSSDLVKLLFEFTVLTCVRSGEARGARWSEIDLTAKVWTVPKSRMKAGVEHRVPLVPRAVAILKAAKKLAPQSDLVFPNGKGNEFSDMTLTQILRRMNLNYTMHGFRSSFRDWAAEKTKHPREAIEFALAHTVDNKTEASYFRSDLFARRRKLMTDWAKFVAGGAK